MCNSLHNRCAIARSQSKRQRACVISYADGHREGCAQQTWTYSGFCSLPLTQTLCSLNEHRVWREAPQGRPTKPVVSLRLLAYPEPGYRQRLTTWKKNGRYLPAAKVRIANRTNRTHYGFCSLGLANPTLGDRAIAQRLCGEYTFAEQEHLY